MGWPRRAKFKSNLAVVQIADLNPSGHLSGYFPSAVAIRTR